MFMTGYILLLLAQFVIALFISFKNTKFHLISYFIALK